MGLGFPRGPPLAVVLFSRTLVYILQHDWSEIGGSQESMLKPVYGEKVLKLNVQGECTWMSATESTMKDPSTGNSLEVPMTLGIPNHGYG